MFWLLGEEKSVGFGKTKGRGVIRVGSRTDTRKQQVRSLREREDCEGDSEAATGEAEKKKLESETQKLREE